MIEIEKNTTPSLAFQSAIVSLLSDYREKKIGESSFYNAIYPRILAFCKYVKNHKKASYFNDDILDDVTQRVMINVFKWGDKIDLTQNSMGYLYKMVLREVYQSNKENAVIRVNGQTDEEGNKLHFASVDSIDKEVFEGAANNLLDINIAEISEIDSHAETEGQTANNSIDSRIDRESALNKIANLVVKNDNCLYYLNNKSYKQMKDNFMSNNTAGSTGFTMKPQGIAGVNAKAEVKVEHKLQELAVPMKNKKRNIDFDTMAPKKKELYRIKELLHLSLEEFAERVGVSTPVMSSYLYRDNVSPRQWVVDAALKLEADNSEICAKVMKLKEEYGHLDMSAILKLWSEKLNFDLENTKLVAEIFDTSATTILRWKNDCNKPPLLNIQSYYEIGVYNLRTNPELNANANVPARKPRAKNKKNIEAIAA